MRDVACRLESSISGTLVHVRLGAVLCCAAGAVVVQAEAGEAPDVWAQLSTVVEDVWDEQQEFGCKDYELKPCTIAAIRGRGCFPVISDSDDEDPHPCFVPVHNEWRGAPELAPLWALRQDQGSEGESETDDDWMTGESGTGEEDL